VLVHLDFRDVALRGSTPVPSLRIELEEALRWRLRALEAQDGGELGGLVQAAPPGRERAGAAGGRARSALHWCAPAPLAASPRGAARRHSSGGFGNPRLSRPAAASGRLTRSAFGAAGVGDGRGRGGDVVPGTGAPVDGRHGVRPHGPGPRVGGGARVSCGSTCGACGPPSRRPVPPVINGPGRAPSARRARYKTALPTVSHKRGRAACARWGSDQPREATRTHRVRASSPRSGAYRYHSARARAALRSWQASSALSR